VLLLSTQHGGENRRSKRRGCAIFLLVLDFAEEADECTCARERIAPTLSTYIHMLRLNPMQRAAVRQLYRRAIRAAQASVPEQRAFSVTYVRSRFYERQVDSNGNKLAEVLTEGWDELERFVSMLSLKGRVTDDGAARLVSRSAVKTPGPPAADAREARGALLADTWNESAVSEWLRDLGLDVHVSAFADARVDGRLLLKLDDEDLLELGVTSKLQRKLILSRCEAFRGQEAIRENLLRT
jgi:hypothetical protein